MTSARVCNALFDGAKRAHANARFLIRPIWLFRTGIGILITALSLWRKESEIVAAEGTGSPVLLHSPSAESPVSPLDLEGLFHWRQVQVRPHASYSYVYATGMQFRPGSPTTSSIQNISPGGVLQIGSNLLIDYTPTLTYYSSDRLRDTLSQSAVLSAQHQTDRWSTSLRSGYVSSSQPLIETGQQTEQEAYDSSVGATYHHGKASFSFGVNQSLNYTTGFNNTKSWSSSDSYDYQLTTMTRLGLGVSGGYVDVSQGSPQSFEQVNGRIQWSPVTKIILTARGGLELRQYLVAGFSQSSPNFSIEGDWRPFNHTVFSIKADQSVQTSLFADQVTEQKDVEINVHQTLIRTFYINLTGGYRWQDYHSTFAGFALTRFDRSRYISAQLGTSIFKHGSIGVFYSRNENTSNVALFSFASQQIGFNVGYRF